MKRKSILNQAGIAAFEVAAWPSAKMKLPASAVSGREILQSVICKSPEK
jgi:hypothetical protein